MKNKVFSLLIIFTIIFSCRPATTETGEENTEEANSDLSGLTYYDLLKQVFEDDGYIFTWNGEPLPNDYSTYLSILKEGTCGSDGCGELLFVSNSSDADTLEIIVTGAYDLKGDTGKITRQYVVPANEKVSIGCSHLCIDGTSYSFERTIVGSKIFVEVPL